MAHGVQALLWREPVAMNVPETSIDRPLSLGSDLPSVACQAAIELDNLILGRANDLPSVRELSARLTQEVPALPDLASPLSLVDPSTVVVLHGTFQEARMTAPSDDIGDLTRQAGEIVRRLRRASDDPQVARTSDREGLRQLKEFCLILSRRSAAANRDVDESRPTHPYRRQG
jgi:hypothetical protein